MECSAKKRGFLAALLIGFLSVCSAASPTSFETAHPFRSVAKYLVAESSGNQNEASIKRALLALSKTQLMTKGVDGAAFMISSKTGGTASRSNITSELEKLRHNSTAVPISSIERNINAAKVAHKAITVQQALRAAELIELGNDALHLLYEAGGEESLILCDPLAGGWAADARACGVELVVPPIRVGIPEARGESNSGEASPEVCVLLLRELHGKWDERGLTVVVVDNLGGSQMFRALGTPSTHVNVAPPEHQSSRSSKSTATAATDGASERAGAGRVRSVGTERKRAGASRRWVRAPVAKAPFAAATSIFTALRTAIAADISAPVVPITLSEASAVSATSASADLELPEAISPSEGTRLGRNQSTAVPLPTASPRPRVRCVGHSFGGSVAALVAGLLDGSIGPALASKDSETQVPESPPVRETTCLTTGICLGPCACVGAAVAQPGVTSIVLGDDIFPRLQPRSIRRLQSRVARLGEPGLGLGGAWLGDALGSTLRNFQHRSELDAREARPASSAVDGPEDTPEGAEGLLLCPGVVYLFKPRAGGGVGVATTKRGGFGEALLWQMHDVLISKSMLAHHLLESYIKVLDRA